MDDMCRSGGSKGGEKREKKKRGGDINLRGALEGGYKVV